MSESPLDLHREFILKMKGDGESNRKIADELGTSEKSVRRALKRFSRTGEVNVSIDKSGITIESNATRIVTDPEELMRELGVKPEEWDVDSVVVNRWGDAGDPQYQLKARLIHKRNLDDLVLPAEIKPPVFRSKPPEPRKDEPHLAVILSDHHAPFFDERLHELTLRFLDVTKPEKGYHLGDLLDFPESSRHRHKPAFKASAKKCLDAGGNILYDLTSASIETSWEFVPGNHDFRIRNAIIDHNADLIGITPAKIPGIGPEKLRPVLSLYNLLHFDALGVEGALEDEADEYQYGQVLIAKNLAGKHGWLAKRGSGATALSTLQQLRYSVVVGHTHRQSIVHHSVPTIGGSSVTLTAAEAGCMCLTNKGLGYDPATDWQNGFLTAVVYPDGEFHLEPVTYDGKSLYWRDNRFN